MDEVDDSFLPDPRLRRRRRIRRVIIGVIVAVVVLECAASFFLSSKLKALVANKLDAQLRTGAVIYLPPYGALLWNPQLVRGEQTLFSSTRGKISLAHLPIAGKPVVFSSVVFNGPVLSLRPGAFNGIAKKKEENAPRKLSEMLRLENVKLFEGRVTYDDGGKSQSPPMVWDGLSIDMATDQQSPSGYNFHVVSRAMATLEFAAGGALDVDSLVFDVQTFSAKVRAEPEPVKSPLPPNVQRVLKDYRASGVLNFDGHATILARRLELSSANLTVALSDTIAVIPRGPNIDHVNLTGLCTKERGGPIRLKLAGVDLAAGSGTQLAKIDGGMLELDPGAATWRMSDVVGSVTAQRKPDAIATAAPTTTFAAQVPTTTPVPMLTYEQEKALSPMEKFDRYQFSGRADFAAAASGTFTLGGKKWWEAIEHEVVLYPRGVAFLPKNFFNRIDNIKQGEVRLKNGMIVFQDLTGHYGGDVLRLTSARLPLEGLPRLAQWQEISGTVVFHQPLLRYSLKLDKVLNALNPEGPFLIAGSWTLDKRGALPKHSYDLIVSSDAGNFAISKYRIPLTQIRGDCSVTNGLVDLHGAQSNCLGGTVQATGKWNRQPLDAPTAGDYEGDLTVTGVDLSKLQPIIPDAAKKRCQGRLFGEASLSGGLPRQGNKLATIRGGGEAELIGGDLYSWPVLKELFEQVKMKQVATVGDAAAVFEVADGIVTVRDGAANAPALGVQGGGKVSLLDDTVDLDLVAAPLADWRDKLKETNIPLISDVASELAGAVQKLLNTATGALLYQFHVGGRLNQVSVTPVPAPVLTQTAATIFGRMLAPPKKNQRPLDWFDRDAPPPPRAASSSTKAK